MFFIAEELREIMATLGFRTVDEMVGRVGSCSTEREIDHWKAKEIDLARSCIMPDVGPEVASALRRSHRTRRSTTIDTELIRPRAGARRSSR